MTLERTHLLFIFFSANALSAKIDSPTIIDGNISRDEIQLNKNGTFGDWFLNGFECCNNIVETNHTESPELQELNKVPDIIYSGNIEEIQDLVSSINKNTELTIAGLANPYLAITYSFITLTLTILGLVLRQYKCRTLRYSMRENSGILRENEFSGNKTTSTYV